MGARLVVLVSGAGTNLQALLDACRDGYGAAVVAVGADRADQRARTGRAGRRPDLRVLLSDYSDRAATGTTR